MKIVRNQEACYGCRTCELFCSFHQSGVFSPSGGAIEVSKDNRTGEIKWHMGSTCNLCKGEEEPLCVRYCRYGALTFFNRGE